MRELAENKHTSKHPIKEYFSNVNVKNKFNEILGNRANAFMTSVLQVCNSSDMLKDADPASVFNAACVAASMDLPLNNSLGFAYIVPFRDNKNNMTVAQFQIGWKGFVQLAQRTGQYKTISTSKIYENQIVSENPLSGYEFDFKRTGEKVIGYAAYFKLMNGFEKTMYMGVEQAKEHGAKYSKTYNSKFSIWKQDFDAMAMKTVLKLLIGKFGPLSTDLQNATLADQAVIRDFDSMELEYIDNDRRHKGVSQLTDIQVQRLNKLLNNVSAEIRECFFSKYESTDKVPPESYDAVAAKLSARAQLVQ